MTIGFITAEYPHSKVKNAAGIGTSIKNLAVSLVKKNIKVIVFVYHQDNNEIISSEGVIIHLIKSKSSSLFAFYHSRKYIQHYINRIVNNENIDILEAPDWSGITAFMKFDIPLIIRFHGSDAYFCKLENRKQKFKNRWFESNALKKAKAYIAPTNFAGQETAKIFDLDINKFKTINYGLQIENFNNENPDKFNKNTILYIGTIIRKKGVFELAHIFNKVIETIPEAELILVGNDSKDLKTGSGSTFKLVKQVFSDKALNHVRYLGQIPYNEVMEHIKSAHVCTFPSFAETLGMVTIESMALNKPVVNTNIGWAQELIQDGISGYLVHPSDIEGFSNAIINLLKNVDLSKRIGKEARIRVENKFDISKITEINIEYYKRFITK